MAKKPINVTNLTSELSTGSAYFSNKPVTKVQEILKERNLDFKKGSKEESNQDLEEALNQVNYQESFKQKLEEDKKEEKVKRKTKNKNMDIYEDQIIAVQELRIKYYKSTGKPLGEAEAYRLIIDSGVAELNHMLDETI